MSKEYIGLLLWQQEKEGVIEKVQQYVDGQQGLTIQEIHELDFVSKPQRSAFVRKIYEGEQIRDDNPKIISDAPISFVIIEDLSAYYEYAITSSGKNVYLNINSFNLKEYIRKFYHWKYLHSTDDYDEFCSTVKNVMNSQLHKPLPSETSKYTGNIINIVDDLYYLHVDNTTFKQTSVCDSPHYHFVKSYLETPIKDFYLSSEHKAYVDYIEQETKYYGNCNHNVKKFIGLIDSFDFKNYDLSNEDKMIKAKGIVRFDPKLLSRLPQQREIDKCLSAYFDDGLIRYDLSGIKHSAKLIGKIALFKDDGLLRVSILHYHKIKDIKIILDQFSPQHLYEERWKWASRASS